MNVAAAVATQTSHQTPDAKTPDAKTPDVRTNEAKKTIPSSSTLSSTQFSAQSSSSSAVHPESELTPDNDKVSISPAAQLSAQSSIQTSSVDSASTAGAFYSAGNALTGSR